MSSFGSALRIAFLARPALLGLVVLCFFLPFANLSCQGDRIDTLSGMNFVTGGHQIEVPPGGLVETVPAYGTALLALICALGGIALCFVQAPLVAIGPVVLSLLGALFLWGLRSQLINEVARRGEGLLAISFEAGYVLAVVCFLVAAGFGVWYLMLVTASSPLGAGPSYSVPAPPPPPSTRPPGPE